ncbi:four-carbon acid sugar kinase family protein [Crateriforma conspicua]|uniref:Hydroxyacid dehydrogenase n=1 Tax=Crateriforma conspicua TaxID=2527996 RepID=A0A5C6FHD4_9PLAN|nr:four-carbon acid sugar kinase family protein [Crateriforma conspicua]TWU60956.1 hypothetical protein V7x_52670 [Crateriforma conspicua]
MTINLQKALAGLPNPRSESLLPAIRQHHEGTRRKIVVLDDDPTGTQTVYDTPVLTTWGVDELLHAMRADGDLFYVLTNSRSLVKQDAVDLARQIGTNLQQAAAASGKDFVLISRSDSTLRGHYPAEVDAVAAATDQPDAIHVIAPFFLQGGRYTVDDVHYVADGDDLIPAAETPFAQDAAFGFQNSNLIDWVMEKWSGSIERQQIHSVGLADLRAADLSPVVKQLRSLAPRSVCVVNAAAMRDMEAFVYAALQAESSGQRFIYRTAASFVQAFAGMEPNPLLRSDQMVDANAKSGLIVVGSYVPKTTGQLNALLSAEPDLVPVVLDVAELLADSTDAYAGSLAQQVNEALASDQDVALYSSRQLVKGDDARSSLSIGNRVSATLVDIVRGVQQRPRFLIAKGGITSSDVATKGLDVHRAMVLGQILPGIPVWQLQQESRMPGMPYVVFPGNVGGESALLDAYRILKR